MATANQDQAQYEMSQIFLGDRVARNRFERATRLATFGVLNRAQSIAPWKVSPDQSMVCIQTYGTHYLLQNIRCAMINEAVGIGPERYCVAFNRAPNFYSKLKLIMNSLPPEKMFMYPARARLEGPFLQEPWLTRRQLSTLDLGTMSLQSCLLD